MHYKNIRLRVKTNFLAAISSSRSDSVTKFVRPSIRSFVCPLFLILKFSCSLKPTMLSKLLTIVLGVIFCPWWTLVKLCSCSMKLETSAEFKFAAWNCIWRRVLSYSMKWKIDLELNWKLKFRFAVWSLG